MSRKSGASELSEPKDRLSRLRGLADRLEVEIATAEGAALASLSRSLVTVLEQIDSLAPPESKGTPLDELAKRRAARPAGPAGRVRAGG